MSYFFVGVNSLLSGIEAYLNAASLVCASSFGALVPGAYCAGSSLFVVAFSVVGKALLYSFVGVDSLLSNACASPTDDSTFGDPLFGVCSCGVP